MPNRLAQTGGKKGYAFAKPEPATAVVALLVDPLRKHMLALELEKRQAQLLQRPRALALTQRDRQVPATVWVWCVFVSHSRTTRTHIY